jgi:hypothetical protein
LESIPSSTTTPISTSTSTSTSTSISTSTTASTKTSDPFGVLGSPGFSAGAFLVSPFSPDGVPDIQLTVYPQVRTPRTSRTSHIIVFIYGFPLLMEPTNTTRTALAANC